MCNLARYYELHDDNTIVSKHVGAVKDFYTPMNAWVIVLKIILKFKLKKGWSLC